MNDKTIFGTELILEVALEKMTLNQILIDWICSTRKVRKCSKGGGGDTHHKNTQGYSSQLEGVSTGHTSNNSAPKELSLGAPGTSVG